MSVFSEPRVDADQPIRILLCLTSVGAGQGGIASTNRNIIRALREMHSGEHPVALHVLVYHGGSPGLDERYLPGDGAFQAQGCHSSVTPPT